MPSIADIRRRLTPLIDPSYKTFVDALQPGVTNRLGVRMPDVRKIAGDILKENPNEVLNAVFERPQHLETQEMRLVTAIVIGRAALTIEERLAYLTRLLPYLDGWVTTDLTGGEMKVFRLRHSALTAYLKGLLMSPRPTDVRLGLVILLNHYKTAERIPDALSFVESAAVYKLARQDYLVSMALAWMAAAFYVVLPETLEDRLLNSLRRGRLDAVTLSRALQKIRDSRAVAASQKAALTARFSEVFARRTGNLA